MHTYEAKSFVLPALDGISQKSVEEHLGLYQGYVKNFNAIKTAMQELMADSEKNSHAISELERRLSFEFDGMRLHEYYFAQWEGGPHALNVDSALGKAIAAEYGNAQEQPQRLLKNIGLMRGPGWAILYWDPQTKCFQAGFSGEQHLGHFVTLPILLALDVWEHSYLLDYGAAGKGGYIDAFFRNINWAVVEKRFDDLQK